MRFKVGVGLLLAVCGGTLRISAGASPRFDDTPKSAQADAVKPATADAAKAGTAKTTVDPDKEKAIRRLMEITGAAKIGVQMSQQLIASIKQTDPSVPEEFWTEFAKKIKPEELVNLIVPIYDKYYSKEDLDGLIAFYESPLGQKVVTSLPLVTRDSVQVGQEWGRSLGEEVVQELQKRYAQPPKPADKPQPKKSKSASGSKTKNKK